MPMFLTDNQVTALKRKRGELNLSTVTLGRQLDLSRWTLDNIFKRNHRKVTPDTYIGSLMSTPQQILKTIPQ